MEGYYTVAQAAQALGIAQRTVRSHIEHGLLKSTKTGRDHFIAEEELQRFRGERRKPGNPDMAAMRAVKGKKPASQPM